MIRLLSKKDIVPAVAIWYAASVQAHPFIEEAFWASQIEAMEMVYLHLAKSWVYEGSEGIHGFVSYQNENLSDLFVSPAFQSQGIGSALLGFLQGKYPIITLTVYCQNQRAYNFYQDKGFVDVHKQQCEHTGHEEILMRWKKH